MSFGTVLKELRLQSGLSQEKLARELDIVTRTYIYYETGKKFPSIDLLSRITKFFKVGISFNIDENGEYTARTQGDSRENLGEKQLIEEISNLFAGGELSEAEKDAMMESLQEAYWKAKKEKQTGGS